MDSLDPEGATPLSYQLPDPARDLPAWPRLQVENRAYASSAFRKMHLEVAVRGDGLQVLHCVVYPRLSHDLPILSMDLVAVDGRVTLAVADPCPVAADLSLPPFYARAVA
jgi:phycocyanobilin:ferredoxin oxidoreductase